MEISLKRCTDPDSILKGALLIGAVGLGFFLLQFLLDKPKDEPFAAGLAPVYARGALFLYRAVLQRGPSPWGGSARPPCRPSFSIEQPRGSSPASALLSHPPPGVDGAGKR
jgi:hypothetical protein